MTFNGYDLSVLYLHMTRVLILERLNDSDPISSYGSLVQAFEILSKRLRDIKDIPLKVSSVQPLDSGMVSPCGKELHINICIIPFPIHFCFYNTMTYFDNFIFNSMEFSLLIYILNCINCFSYLYVMHSWALKIFWMDHDGQCVLQVANFMCLECSL